VRSNPILGVSAVTRASRRNSLFAARVGRVAVALLTASLLSACADGVGGAGGPLIRSIEGALNGQPPRRNDARVSVQRSSSGPLALVWNTPDGRPRVTTLPPGVRSAEVLESREVPQRGEYAAIIAMQMESGSECPRGQPVERIVLSTPARSELASLGQCGAVARLGTNDDRSVIGVQLPNGEWRQVSGTRLVQPGSGQATIGPQRYVGPTLPAWMEGNGRTSGQQGSPQPRATSPTPRASAPQARQPAPAPSPEPRQPSRLDPAALPSAPDGADPARPRAARPNFGI